MMNNFLVMIISRLHKNVESRGLTYLFVGHLSFPFLGALELIIHLYSIHKSWGWGSIWTILGANYLD